MLGGDRSNTYDQPVIVDDGAKRIARKSDNASAIVGPLEVRGTFSTEDDRINDLAPGIGQLGPAVAVSVPGGSFQYTDESFTSLTLDDGVVRENRFADDPSRLQVTSRIDSLSPSTISGDSLVLPSTPLIVTSALDDEDEGLEIRSQIVNPAGGTGSIRFDGPGTLELRAENGANSYSGSTTVHGGTVRLSSPLPGRTVIPGDLIIRGRNSPALVFLSQSDLIANTSTVNVQQQGFSAQLHLGEFPERIGLLTLIGGLVTSTGSGTLTLGGTVLVSNVSTNLPSRISGRLELGSSQRVFQVSDGVPADDLMIDAAVVGAGGLAKFEDGVLRLDGASTYTGTSSLSAGTLLINAPAGTTVPTDVFVIGKGAFGGTGRVRSIRSEGTIAPGNQNTATTRVAENTLSPLSRFVVELNSATSFDQIQTSTLTLESLVSGGDDDATGPRSPAELHCPTWTVLPDSGRHESRGFQPGHGVSEHGEQPAAGREPVHRQWAVVHHRRQRRGEGERCGGHTQHGAGL